MTTTTTFDSKCDILSDLWIQYKGDSQFEDFISYNDLGLPLAYAIATNIIDKTAKSEVLVNETFDLLLQSLNLTDEGFDSLDDLFGGFGISED